ncbi:uncharacterized protein TRIADDRAFT_59794 [Trichoplax adhaerens]|uniref:Peptidase M14 domain-containing protein n=1 Tax=Trichoplax adhaerens TaxID=10228 RepID=B3S6G2_TRIAD|nr:hypothetical protein TRIADDRAFT_59794 [Trichoplax adhaerens]EDV21753.1 hypothetical protein TRIADDRAFT_59794 [Trichoplax adhaerens]|eukprot:XP_002115901.1 hypothetical protein TRIADDRAFT_59794 [Trichoplax adhaerens]
MILIQSIRSSILLLLTIVLLKIDVKGFHPYLAECGDVKPRQELYYPDYNIYHNYKTTKELIITLADNFKDYIRLDLSYVSRLGEPQLLVRVTNFTHLKKQNITNYWRNDSSKKRVKLLISSGEHARELIPTESVIFLLTNITNGLKHSGDKRPMDNAAYRFSHYILTYVDLFIIVMLNPDGRKYAERTRNYCWRGTSTGVDLNRNFEWQFGGSGSSSNKEDEEYRGPHSFSEPECNVLLDLTSQYEFDAFFSLHAGIKHIYVPYSDSMSQKIGRKPANIKEQLKLASIMAKSSASKFTYGHAYDLNDYAADGTVFDYMAGKRNIPFSFAIELWGNGDNSNKRCFDLFNPHSQDLKAALESIYPIFVAGLTSLIQKKLQRNQNKHLFDAKLNLYDNSLQVHSQMSGMIDQVNQEEQNFNFKIKNVLLSASSNTALERKNPDFVDWVKLGLAKIYYCLPAKFF